LKSLFTGLKSFHLLVAINAPLYSYIVFEVTKQANYQLDHDWAAYQGTALGFFSGLIYVLRQNYVLRWTQPQQGRTAAVLGALPHCVMRVSVI
jgi:hypothetical protein